MSGGSFDYLCWKDPADLIYNGELSHMADALTALGYAEDAARETEDLIAIVAQYERRAGVRLRRLQDVWRTMEWWHSNDSGEEDVKAALAAYREGKA